MNLEDLTLKELVILNRMIEDRGREWAIKTPLKWHGGVDQLESADIPVLEGMYRVLHEQHPNVEQLFGPHENTPIESLIGAENMEALLRGEHAVMRGNDSAIRGNYESEILNGGIATTEAIKAKVVSDNAVSGGHEIGTIRGDRETEILSGTAGTTEAMVAQIRKEHAVSGGQEIGSIRGDREYEISSGSSGTAEAMIAQLRREHAVSGGNDSGIRGNYESEILNGGIETTEAMVAKIRRDNAVSGGHEIGTIRGTVEDMENPGNAGEEQWKASFDHVKYLDSVLSNPHQIDDKRFREAVLRGIKDNSVFSRHFTPKLIGTLGEQVKLITSCPTDMASLQALNEKLSLKLFSSPEEIGTFDRDQVRAMAKTNVEAYLNVYSRLIAELRVADAEIDPSYVDIFSEKDGIFEAGKYVGPIKMPIPFSGIRGDKVPLELMGHAVGVLNALKFNFKNPSSEYRGGVLGENDNPSDLPDIVRQLRQEAEMESAPTTVVETDQTPIVPGGLGDGQEINPVGQGPMQPVTGLAIKPDINIQEQGM